MCLSPAQAPPSRWGRPLRPSMPTAAGQGCRLKRGRQGQTARRTGRPQRATRRTLRTSSAEAASGRVPTLRGRGADVVVGPGRGHRGAGLAGSDSSARCRCPRAEFQVRRSGVGRTGARGVKDGAERAPAVMTSPTFFFFFFSFLLRIFPSRSVSVVTLAPSPSLLTERTPLSCAPRPASGPRPFLC